MTTEYDFSELTDLRELDSDFIEPFASDEKTGVQIIHDGETVLSPDPEQVEISRARMGDIGATPEKILQKVSFRVNIVFGRERIEASDNGERNNDKQTNTDDADDANGKDSEKMSFTYGDLPEEVGQ